MNQHSRLYTQGLFSFICITLYLPFSLVGFWICKERGREEEASFGRINSRIVTVGDSDTRTFSSENFFRFCFSLTTRIYVICIRMTESKVLLDTVIKHLSDTLHQHDHTIRRLESSVESIQSQIDTRFTTIRTENQDELRSLQTNLTSLIESKHAL